ncbi:MAG: chorismate synthase [Acholeplasmatales bacterium]|nr:MAG: chorismate synthase [Acholeplasmatales bacterium]
MNQFGTLYRITLYGESHQPAIGVVIDGVPPGTPIDPAAIAADLKRRNPPLIGTTPRKEPDAVILTSGILNGVATGSPIHAMIENKNVRSHDYDHLKAQPRPGHADFVAKMKYGGHQDPRGGGRFSGRLTAPLVVAGSIAKMFLPYTFSHRLIQVGSLKDMDQLDAYLTDIAAAGDSVGGIIEVRIEGVPVGIGEPMFQKLDAALSSMMFAIPAVKGVEIGTGFSGITMTGSDFNDRFIAATGQTTTNHAGGITGGLSNGNPIVFNVFVKPTSSIAKGQETYAYDTESVRTLAVKGRHDVCIARRAGIVLENAAAIVFADLTLHHRASKPL